MLQLDQNFSETLHWSSGTIKVMSYTFDYGELIM